MCFVIVSVYPCLSLHLFLHLHNVGKGGNHSFFWGGEENDCVPAYSFPCRQLPKCNTRGFDNPVDVCQYPCVPEALCTINFTFFFLGTFFVDPSPYTINLLIAYDENTFFCMRALGSSYKPYFFFRWYSQSYTKVHCHEMGVCIFFVCQPFYLLHFCMRF